MEGLILYPEPNVEGAEWGSIPITMAKTIVTKVSQDLICVEMLDAGTKPHAGLVCLQLEPSREETRESLDLHFDTQNTGQHFCLSV